MDINMDMNMFMYMYIYMSIFVDVFLLINMWVRFCYNAYAYVVFCLFLCFKLTNLFKEMMIEENTVRYLHIMCYFKKIRSIVDFRISIENIFGVVGTTIATIGISHRCHFPNLSQIYER